MSHFKINSVTLQHLLAWAKNNWLQKEDNIVLNPLLTEGFKFLVAS